MVGISGIAQQPKNDQPLVGERLVLYRRGKESERNADVNIGRSDLHCPQNCNCASSQLREERVEISNSYNMPS